MFDIFCDIFRKKTENRPTESSGPSQADRVYLDYINSRFSYTSQSDPGQAYNDLYITLIVIDDIDKVVELDSLASISPSVLRIIPQLPPNTYFILITRDKDDILSNLRDDFVAKVALGIYTQVSIDEVRDYMAARLKDGIATIFRGRMAWESWPSKPMVCTYGVIQPSSSFILAWRRMVLMDEMD
jgi:hypothetical protein